MWPATYKRSSQPWLTRPVTSASSHAFHLDTAVVFTSCPAPSRPFPSKPRPIPRASQPIVLLKLFHFIIFLFKVSFSKCCFQTSLRGHFVFQSWCATVAFFSVSSCGAHMINEGISVVRLLYFSRRHFNSSVSFRRARVLELKRYGEKAVEKRTRNALSCRWNGC